MKKFPGFIKQQRTNLPALILLLLYNCLQEYSFLAIQCSICVCIGCVCAWLWSSICAALGPVEVLGLQAAFPLFDLCRNTRETLSPPALFWVTAVTSAAAALVSAPTKVRGSYLIDFRDQTERKKRNKKKEREQGNEIVCGVFSISLMCDISIFSFD